MVVEVHGDGLRSGVVVCCGSGCCCGGVLVVVWSSQSWCLLVVWRLVSRAKSGGGPRGGFASGVVIGCSCSRVPRSAVDVSNRSGGVKYVGRYFCLLRRHVKRVVKSC